LTTMNGTGRFRAEDVARALAGLAGKSRVVYHEKSKKTSRSKPLRLTALRAWVDNNSGLFEWDDVKAAIEKSMQYEKNKPDVHNAS